MFEEESSQIERMTERLAELRACLNVDAAQQQIKKLEAAMSAQGFWDDNEAAQKTVQQLKAFKRIVDAPEALRKELEDAAILVELAQGENEASMAAEITETISQLEARLNSLEIASLFSDPRDSKNAIVNIHPGAGGTESCDWAEMLYRMIVRYCERQEFAVEVLDYQEGEEAGLKSAALMVTGPSAYGYLKSEAGVHRLVRISPFDANSRRHTSFAAVEVLPELDDTIDIEIREEDLKMDVFRSSGAGGQKVNKTSSAVRLTHTPSGIVVACQVERSQHRNRALAESLLKAKLYDIELQKKQAELDKERGEQKDVAWGSQIRSYVLHPYQLVKDLRTQEETGNVVAVLDGDIDRFVEAYLKWRLDQGRQKAVGED